MERLVLKGSPQFFLSIMVWVSLNYNPAVTALKTITINIECSALRWDLSYSLQCAIVDLCECPCSLFLGGLFYHGGIECTEIHGGFLSEHTSSIRRAIFEK